MKLSEDKLFWHAMQPIIGSVIGVGIFGLPYVFAQAGFLVGVVHLFLIGAANLVILLAFAEILMRTDGHHRFTGVVERYLGKGWSWVATGLAFFTGWGAMIAYVIIGGEFLHALLAPLLGGPTVLYQLIFYFVSALLLIGGMGFIARLELIFVFVLLVMLALIVSGSLPLVDAENLLYVVPQKWFAPFGVVLFAFGGLAAVPEVSHMLGKKKKKLRNVVMAAMLVVTLVYILFSGAVVAVTGLSTTPEAILGLGAIVGPWITVIGSVVGLFSVFTSFLIIGLSIIDTQVYDFQQRYLSSWAITVSVPLVIFLFGARSFIGVIGFTGGILAGLTGMLVVLLYVWASRDPRLPKRSFDLPEWLMLSVGVFFTLGVLLTAVGV